MRVQCIEVPPPIENYTLPILELGQVYSVVRSGGPSRTINGWTIGEWYELAEHARVCYEQTLFIPVSDIDETEMIRNYQTEKV